VAFEACGPDNPEGVPLAVPRVAPDKHGAEVSRRLHVGHNAAVGADALHLSLYPGTDKVTSGPRGGATA
jgi:hypothetical protein